MFYEYQIQYPAVMEVPNVVFPERTTPDKWLPTLRDLPPTRLTLPVFLMPYFANDTRWIAPPEVVMADKWFYEGILFNPRINPVVNQRYYPSVFLTRCYPIHTYLSKNTTVFTYPSKNTTSYTYPSKNTTAHTYQGKLSNPC